MDEVETCMDLNLRMQSILVKTHVLEALSTHEQDESQKRKNTFEFQRYQSANSHYAIVTPRAATPKKNPRMEGRAKRASN
jgi:hypothetical protein